MKHSKNNITKHNVNSKNVIKDWGLAIAEARAQLAEVKVRAARLKAAIRLFTQKQKSGEPWLEDKTAGTAVDSAPAKG